MNNKNQKILLTLLFAFALNASVWAFAIVNNGTNYSAIAVKSKVLTPHKSFNNNINSGFENFIERFTTTKASVFYSFDINNIAFKPIDNVRIFPNPVSTQINISFTLSKDNQVVIKILDVLGNEILTLLNQKMQAGEQINSFVLDSKIPIGFYFVRIFTGNDSVIKRISVI